MYCRNCGKKIEDGSAVCPHCGEVLRAEGGYWEVKPKKSEKKGLPVVPLIALLVFAAISIVIFLILGPEFGNSDSKPYGGAKVKKQTVRDNDLLTVTAEGLDRASGEYYYCDALGLTIRNKAGQPLSVRCSSMTVNGAAVQPVLRAEIPAGETVQAELVMDHFSRDDMRIRTIAAITMELEASAAGSTDVVRSGILTVETTKKGKGEVPGFKYEAQPLYEANGIRVGTEGFRTIGTTMAYGGCFHVENGSGETIRDCRRVLCEGGFFRAGKDRQGAGLLSGQNSHRHLQHFQRSGWKEDRFVPVRIQKVSRYCKTKRQLRRGRRHRHGSRQLRHRSRTEISRWQFLRSGRKAGPVRSAGQKWELRVSFAKSAAA